MWISTSSVFLLFILTLVDVAQGEEFGNNGGRSGIHVLKRGGRNGKGTKNKNGNDFGSVTLSDNWNTALEGTKNEGTVKDNTNIKIKMSNSKLNVVSNTNIKLEGNKSHLTISHTTNVKTSGGNNTIQSADDTNAEIHGKNVIYTLEGNTNIKLKGNGNKGTFIRNTNLKMDGNDADIVAKDNTNLKFLKNKNHVRIEGTTNHQVENVYRDSKSTKNKMTVKIQQNRDTDSFSFEIEYLKTLNITSGKDYSVGVIRFRMEEFKKCRVVHFDPNLFDKSSLAMVKTSDQEYSISGAKDGKKETLDILAPFISMKAGKDGVQILTISKTKATTCSK